MKMLLTTLMLFLFGSAALAGASPVKQEAPAAQNAQQASPAPVQQAVPTQEPAPVQQAAPVQKPAPVQQATSPVQKPVPPAPKPAPVQQATPVQKPAPVQQAAPVQKPAPVQQAVPAPVSQQDARAARNISRAQFLRQARLNRLARIARRNANR